MQGTEAARPLQIEGLVERLARDREEQRAEREVAGGEVPVAEQAGIEARVVFARFGVQEGGDQDEAGSDARPDLPATPAAEVAALDQAVGQAEQAERGQTETA